MTPKITCPGRASPRRGFFVAMSIERRRMRCSRCSPRSARGEIAERYAAGETMAELAREYEVGEATIFRALQGPFDQAA